LDANVASTAAVVLGREAPDWLSGHGLTARLVHPDGTVVRVGGWPADQTDAPFAKAMA
jgi:thiamine biosynthesis lipoprotein